MTAFFENLWGSLQQIPEARHDCVKKGLRNILSAQVSRLTLDSHIQYLEHTLVFLSLDPQGVEELKRKVQTLVDRHSVRPTEPVPQIDYQQATPNNRTRRSKECDNNTQATALDKAGCSSSYGEGNVGLPASNTTTHLSDDHNTQNTDIGCFGTFSTKRNLRSNGIERNCPSSVNSGDSLENATFSCDDAGIAEVNRPPHSHHATIESTQQTDCSDLFKYIDFSQCSNNNDSRKSARTPPRPISIPNSTEITSSTEMNMASLPTPISAGDERSFFPTEEQVEPLLNPPNTNTTHGFPMSSQAPTSATVPVAGRKRTSSDDNLPPYKKQNNCHKISILEAFDRCHEYLNEEYVSALMANLTQVDTGKVRLERSLSQLYELDQSLSQNDSKVCFMRRVVSIRFRHYYLEDKKGEGIKECKSRWGKNRWDDVVKRSKKSHKLYQRFPESVFFPIPQSTLQKISDEDLDEVISTLRESNYKSDLMFQGRAINLVGIQGD